MSVEHPFRLSNAEALAAKAPYTFFIPSREEREAVVPGAMVKLVFEYLWDGRKLNGERMWVKVTHVQGQEMTGLLDNRPYEEGLEEGMVVNFAPANVVEIEWGDAPHPEVPTPRQFWQRCYVDECVVEGCVPVGFLYREEPDLEGSDEKYPDSGWRIRGRETEDPADSLDRRKIAYVALGAVLNADDSVLDLLEAPVGSAFVRDEESGEYRPA
ncbi:MAG: DUF2185 domain-containing protein [Sphingomonadales bacterium]|nr:DUF2185 domain-containing protein [Sphingomonadales bacterium]MDE2569926.1 DUF2185 domain-containing protein [Sphingomonadales bacterium]